MAQVHSFKGHKVVIYSNDHCPAHVHVLKAENEAIFNLNCPDGPPDLRENDGFRLKELTAIRNELQAVIKKLCDAWRAIHGDA